MESKEIEKLLSAYYTGELTPAEKASVEQWYLATHEIDPAVDTVDLEAAQQRSLAAMHRHIHPARTIRWWPSVAVAAAVILLLATGTYYYTQQQRTGRTIAVNTSILPGKQSATLTLADGRKITLSDAATGELASEAGVTITKNKAGEIVYTVKDSEVNVDLINTLTTGNGETWHVNLPDGTTVWLNAASSIKYPSSFRGKAQRRITLIGEAFFRVAPDAQHPFIVQTDKQETEVLGTSFNITAYPDEQLTYTALVDGSVRVTAGGKQQVLQPGEGTLLNDGTLIKQKANLEEVTAWRDGYFNFYDQDMESIMRSIARWYDVEVVYEGKMTTERFNGAISRDKSIHSILSLLESTGFVHFEIQGRKIIVKP